MNDNIRIVRYEPVPPPTEKVRLVEFLPGTMTADGPGLRIEVAHPGAGKCGKTYSVTFADNRGSWPASRWTDLKRSDIVALRDALTQLLNDNP